MSAADRVVVVSGDGHMSAPLESYRQYLEPKHHQALEELEAENRFYLDTAAKPRRPRGEVLEIIDGRGALGEGELGSNGEAGSFDVGVRLRELDAEGIAAEVIHFGDQCNITPFFSTVNKPCSPELRMAGARAHNRKVAEYLDEAKGRLAAIAELGPCVDLDATIAELRWAAEHGFVGVTTPGSPSDPSLPPLVDRAWDPLWAAVAETGLALSVHAGWGRPQGEIVEFFERLNAAGAFDAEGVERAISMMQETPLTLDIGPRRVLWQLMIGGAFDRHPTLKLALTEIRADWIPATLTHLDETLTGPSAPDAGATMQLKPSEYFERQCIVTPSSIHAAEVAMRHEIGVDQLCFGADYPHYEGTWPNTRDWYRAAFVGVPIEEARKILGENALTFYGLDRAAVEAAGRRVGPTVDEVIGGQPVPEPLVQHFHTRSGYLRPADPVDVDAIDATVKEELTRVGI